MKTRKLRLVSALLAVAMMLALLPTAVFAEDNHNCGATSADNVTWKLENNTLTISGTGKMADYTSVDKQPWAGQRSNIKHLVVENGVTSIGDNAFRGCTNLIDADMSKALSLTTIGTSFWGCHKLQSVELNEGLQTIGGSAFTECFYTSPGSINIPSTVTAIGSWCFQDCEKLEKVTFAADSKLTTIEGGTFISCHGLKTITIPKSVKEIRQDNDNGAFSGCNGLESVTFEPGSELEKVAPRTFSGCRKMKIYYSNKEVKQALTDAGVRADKIKPANPTVTFDSNGGSNVEPATVKNRNTISAPAVPTREGWNFAGWYTKDESGKWADKPFDFRTPITDNMTLYARWGVEATPITPATRLYPITIHYGTAYDAEGNPIEKAAAGDVVTIKADETALEGMTFDRWEVRAGDVKLTDDRAAETSFTMPAGEVQLEAMAPATRLYPITIDYGTAYDAEGKPIEKAAAGDVVTIKADESALEGMTFDRWEVRAGDVKLTDDRAAETSFTMPAGEVQLEAMYQAADVHDSGWDAATVVTGAVIGTGTAILAYHIGMEVYAQQVLGKDVAVPRTRGEVALLAWQLAGSPAVNVEGEPLSEAAQAERWAVESGLMQPDAEGNFHAEKKLSKWKALRTLDAAKKQV